MPIPINKISEQHNFYLVILLIGLGLYATIKSLYPTGFRYVFEKKASNQLSFNENLPIFCFMLNYALFLSAILLFFLEDYKLIPKIWPREILFLFILGVIVCFWMIKRMFRLIAHWLLDWPVALNQTYGVYNLYRSRIGALLFLGLCLILYSPIEPMCILILLALIFIGVYFKASLILYRLASKHIPIYSFIFYIYAFEILPLCFGAYQLLNKTNP